MQCAQCGHDRALASGERVGFRDACEGCGADLHTCAQCAHHDPSAYNECREEGSERVSERERANRCDYFRPTDRVGGEGDTRSAALSDLEALFKK